MKIYQRMDAKNVLIGIIHVTYPKGLKSKYEKKKDMIEEEV